MKRQKTTNKLTDAERRELEAQVDAWANARGKPTTKAERKMRWQQIVFAKVKADAQKRKQEP
jgi:hypothetical protein